MSSMRMSPEGQRVWMRQLSVRGSASRGTRVRTTSHQHSQQEGSWVFSSLVDRWVRRNWVGSTTSVPSNITILKIRCSPMAQVHSSSPSSSALLQRLASWERARCLLLFPLPPRCVPVWLLPPSEPGTAAAKMNHDLHLPKCSEELSVLRRPRASSGTQTPASPHNTLCLCRPPGCPASSVEPSSGLTAASSPGPAPCSLLNTLPRTIPHALLLQP